MKSQTTVAVLITVALAVAFLIVLAGGVCLCFLLPKWWLIVPTCLSFFLNAVLFVDIVDDLWISGKLRLPTV